jgi:hypothetical protein
MAKKFGNSYLLWINRGGTFYPISGQQSLSKPQSAGSIDIGDKNSAPYTLEAPALLSVGITGEVWPDLPDVNGFEYLYSLLLSQAAEFFQIRQNGLLGNGTTDVEFHASMYVMGADKTLPRNGVNGYSIKLGLAAVPIINKVL